MLQNKLDTGTLGFSNIENKADFKAEHQGGSLSSGCPVGSDLLSNLGGVVLSGLGNDGHAEGTTQAAVSEGTITIRDQANQQQDVEDLSRDTDNANGSIGPIFDKEKEQNRLREAQLIGEIGGQAMDIAAAAVQGLAGGNMAAVNAALAAAQGNNALVGAGGAVTGELSETEKQTVSALATLAAGLAGGLIGDSTADTVAGAQTGKTVVENNALSSLGDVFGSQGAKYFEGAASLEKELLQDSNLTDQEKQIIRDQYIKGDLPEDVIKAILENNPGSDTVMALLNAKNPEDYALALLSTLPAERALALIGKMTKGAQATGAFNIADRVYAQLNDSRLGSLSGKLNAAELQKLANNPAAVRVYDARSGHINVIQSVDGKLLRITVPNNEMKIISVGPIRPNQVKNLIEKGSFVPLP